MLTGVILAGGKNDILQDTLKSLLLISGRYTIDYQISEMKKICNEIIIVTNTPKAYLQKVPKDVRIITDYFQDCGPLGGMYSALSLAKNRHIWITACGMPFISSQAASYMHRLIKDCNADAVLPNIKSNVFPFHGIYNKKILPTLKLQMRFNNKSFESLINSLNWFGVSYTELSSLNIPETFVFSIKSHKDYELAEKLANKKKNLT